MADNKWKFLLQYAETIYKNEQRREHNIIEQAARMQSAFSFVIAALFVLIPTIIEYSTIPIHIIVVAFSLITICLISSLVFATVAQNRKKRHDFPPISKMIEEVNNNSTYYESEEQQQKYLAETYCKIHDNYERNNNLRSLFLKISMWSFYASIVFCIIWFIVFICL